MDHTPRSPPPPPPTQQLQKPPTKFFGVWIPPSSTSSDSSCVTSDLKTVTSLLARNPGSRFLVASSEAEALTLIQDEDGKKEEGDGDNRNSCNNYYEEGTTLRNAPLTPQHGTFQNNNNRPRRRQRLSLPASNSSSRVLSSSEAPSTPTPSTMTTGNSNNKPTRPSGDGEKSVSKFPSVKTQDLTALARDITRGISIVQKVTANPRLLATDCDLPTTVQEGCHYNALHVAAKANNSEAISFILNMVGSLNYFRLMGNSNDDIAMLRARLIHLSDGYLNTPDKMTNETPLHFASKFLAVEAVEVLVSHPLTDKNVRNIYKELPIDIIGLRGSKDSPDFEEKKKRIHNLLGERVVVPLWKDSISGAASSSVLGEKSTIRQLGESIPAPLLKHFPDFDVGALGQCSSSVYPKKHNALRMFSCDSSWTICAFAGPMTVNEASQLIAALKLTSGLKLRPTCSELNAPFTPPSTPPFLSSTPLSPMTASRSTPEVSVTSPLSPTPIHTSLRLSDPEKGLERIASKFCRTLGVPWAEWWWPFGRNFFFGDLASPEGLKALSSRLDVSFIQAQKQEREEEINSLCDQFLDQLATKFDALNLNTSIGYPTPHKSTECRNPQCKMDGRFCTCEGVAPPLPSSVCLPITKRLLVSELSENEPIQAHSLEQNGIPENQRRRDVLETSVESTASDKSSLNSGYDDVYEIEESFESAHTSDDESEEEFFDCKSKPFFFNGLFPTKQDFQLCAALEENETEISLGDYPLVFQWINVMKSLGGKSTKALKEHSKASPAALHDDYQLGRLSQSESRRASSSSSSSSRSSNRGIVGRKLEW